MWNCICYNIQHAWYMEHSNLEIFLDHDVDAVVEQRIELWLTSQRSENVDCVHAVHIYNDFWVVFHCLLQVIAGACYSQRLKIKNDVVCILQWYWCVKSCHTMWIPETNASQWNITIDGCIHILGFPANWRQNFYAKGPTHVFSIMHHIVNPDFFEWLIFASNLWIDSVQHWME